MKTINIIFLVIISQVGFGQNSDFNQKIYEGKSSLILDNKKDIIHVSNNNYKKKLIYDATVNAIKQACPTLINIEEFSFGDFDQADQDLKSTDRIVFNSKSGIFSLRYFSATSIVGRLRVNLINLDKEPPSLVTKS